MKRLSAVLSALFFASASLAHAQSAQWPTKPVRVIVPLAPGGSVDTVARLVSARLSEKYGQQFVVDNRGGGGSTLGIGMVARATPDGYTLLMMSSAFSATPALYKLSYDPLKDIAPIALMADGPMFLAVHPGVKAANLKEFIALAKAKPGSISYGSAGAGSSTHLATELFMQMSGTSMLHVPYKGIGAALTDLLGGQIQLYIAPGAALLQYVATGKLRVVAATGEKRSRELPDVQTVNELVPGYIADFWYGFGAPGGTPKAIIAQLNAELGRILAQPELQKRLRSFDLDAAHSTPEEFSRRIAREVATWTQVVKTANISLE